MADLAVAAGTALVDGRVAGPVVLRVAGGRVAAVEPDTGGDHDLVAATVVPGLVDVHTHGAAGVQVIDGPEADLDRLARFYVEHGVTGFVATVGGSREHLLAGAAAVAAYAEEPAGRGARCLGLHLEGPFISADAPGAFRPESILEPDESFLRELLDAAGGHLRLLTLAPESPGAARLVALARAHGVTCSAGHTVASAAQMHAAADAGVRGVTHLFNAMAPFHHREPGPVGAAITDDRLVCELIADGVHVHPDAARLAVRAKGVEGVALVSDSIAATGLPDGTYAFEEQEMTVSGGEARLADGTLAGSTLTLDRAVANLARWTGLPLVEAARCASEVPARLVDTDHGTLSRGGRADLAGFDEDDRLVWTLVGGELHEAPR